MPLLDVRRFQGQFPRGSPGQSTRAIALPQARGQDPGAQALGRFGQVLERIGTDLSAIDAQFANAKAQTLSVEASTTLAGEAQALQFQISTDPTIYPSDRADAFVAQIERRVETLGANVPELGRARYVAASTRAVQKAAQTLRIKGYEESIARATQAYEQEQERLQRSLLTAQTDVQRAEIAGDLRANTQQMVNTGIFTPEEATERFQGFVHDTAQLQLELLMETDPKTALAQLETGMQGNPNVRPADLPELIQRARQRWDSQLRREATAEARAQTRRTQQQNMKASEYRVDLYAEGATSAELLTLQNRANDDREARLLNEADHAEFLRTIEVKLAKIADNREEDGEAGTQTDLAIRIHMAGTPQELGRLEQDVIASQNDLPVSAVSTLLGNVRQQRERTSFTNRPNYREGLRIMLGISGAFSAGMIAQVFDQLTGAPKAKMRTMMDQYRDEMSNLVSQGVTALDARAVPLARELRNAYFPVGAALGAPPLPTELSDEALPWSRRMRTLGSMPIVESLKHQYFEQMEAERTTQQAAKKAKIAKDAAEAERDSQWFFQRWFGNKEVE